MFADASIKGYKVMGIEYVLLPEFFVFSSIFLIFSNYRKIKDLFFEAKDLDMLQSLPIKKEYIIISKAFELYLFSFLITTTIMLPPYILYIINVPVSILFHILFFITLFIIPCIPLVLAIALGYLISYISSFFNKKERIQTILTITALAIGIYVGQKSAYMTSETIADFGKSFLNLFNRIYPITKTYKDILIDGNILSLFVFIILNIAMFTGLILVISKTFDKLNGRIHQIHKSKNTKIKYRKKLSITKALLDKDFKKLFSSTNYLLNSCMGVVITILIIGSLMFKLKNFTFTISGAKDLSYALSFVVLMMSGFTYPAAVSLSLEGKSFNILKTLPISFNDIIKEKTIFELIISMPFALAATIAISIKMKYSMYYTSLFILITIFALLLYTSAHILFDTLFLKLEWTQEIKIVKQSLQTFLSIILAMLVGILPLVVLNGKHQFKYCLIALIVLFIIVRYILRVYGKRKFEISYN